MSDIIINLYGIEETASSTDYIGFTFNGTHSSALGIVRTSDGSRFNENLLPVIQDKTVPVPGGDGTYFFGSYYTQRMFNINFAFDKMTEEQLSNLKAWLGDKKIHDLVFDEAPYKIYRAKITGSATIKHIPFEEGETNRVYKGEGSIQFTAYNPYARSAFKFLEQVNYKNQKEWELASGMKQTQGIYDVLNEKQIKLYNPGDKETDFILTLNFVGNLIPAMNISIFEDDSRQMNLETINKIGEDDCVKINTKLNLIEGYKNGFKTGNVYNKYLIEGDYFKIPMGESTLTFSDDSASPSIEYDYLYL